MKDYYVNMFYVPFFHLETRDWNNKRTKLFDILNSNSLSDNDGVQTDFFKSKSYENEVYEILQEELNLFKTEFNFSKIEIINSWFEVASNTEYHPIHNHAFSHYSFVCYMKYDEIFHTPTQFISPFNNFLTNSVMRYSPSNISEGSIIFFPSMISHFTEPNFSQESRIVISGNLKVS